MTAQPASKILRRYRLSLGLFIIGLVVSGITAFPLRHELTWLNSWLEPERHNGGWTDWISYVHAGVTQTYDRYPFFGYGTDWLAFGHLVISTFFVLPLIDPARYRPVLKLGLVACAGVIALAVICGPIRSIPFFWTLIDCSFGVFAAIPLGYCLFLTRDLT